MFLLASRRLVCPAADDDFVIYQNAQVGKCLCPSQHLVCLAANDDFVICQNACVNKSLCF